MRRVASVSFLLFCVMLCVFQMSIHLPSQRSQRRGGRSRSAERVGPSCRWTRCPVIVVLACLLALAEFGVLHCFECFAAWGEWCFVSYLAMHRRPTERIDERMMPSGRWRLLLSEFAYCCTEFFLLPKVVVSVWPRCFAVSCQLFCIMFCALLASGTVAHSC